LARKEIDTLYRHDLIAVRPPRRRPCSRHMDQGDERVVKYDLLHVAPPQSAPDFIKRSPLANAAGWVDVRQAHAPARALPRGVVPGGLLVSLPTSRTGAAIRKQAPVLVENLLASREDRALTGLATTATPRARW
jgi:sulfide:quinone oxidoreductase